MNFTDNKKLEYRRQFILHSGTVTYFESWNRMKVAESYTVEIHPDLSFYQIKSDEKELSLIGYIIDSEKPNYGDKEILKDLIEGVVGLESLFELTLNFSGRWILFFSDENEFIIFTDPTGLRSLFYTNCCIENLYCSSQPGLIADILNLEYDQISLNAYVKSGYVKNLKEYWLPCGTSFFKEINQLVPNHYLDVLKRKIVRFWPNYRLKRWNLNDTVSFAADKLTNLLLGANERFELALSLTSGLDSRTLLAATNKIQQDLFYYTLIYYDLTYKSPDVFIPNRLLESLGLQHHILDCSMEMDDSFRKVYMQNVNFAHEAWGSIAYGLSQSFPSDKVAIKGNCSEIARCFYHKYVYPKNISGNYLTKLIGMNGNVDLAAKHLDRWLAASYPIAKESGIDILDLFYWEHRIGSWQSMSQLEWDIIMETFTPFNCRSLLASLLGVKKIYRIPPNYNLFREIINSLWPELLKEPINPQFFIFKYKPLMIKILNFTKIYNLARKFYSNIWPRY